MEKIIIKAPAKLNLFLNITGKRKDGYHLLESVMQSVNIFDIVTIEKTCMENLEIICSNKLIPCDERNIAYKAVNAVFEYKKIKTGLRILIEKHIPIEAGMGGSSADGAAVIIGLNKLLNLNLTDEEKIVLAEKIGADVPFMLFNGTAFVQGIGEKVERLKSIENIFFVVVKPNISINTKKAYEEIDNIGLNSDVDINKILMAVKEMKTKGIADNLFNIFELIAPDEISLIKAKLESSGAISSLMTGSGSAVYGIFNNLKDAENAKTKISNDYENVFVCKAIPGLEEDLL